MKISIIGYSGSGKSTFASNLENIYNIEPIFMDQLFFNPNWVQVPKEIFASRISEIISKKEWITDGNYSSFSQDRIKNSDIIYIFRFNRLKTFYNLIKRRIKYHNKVRPSAAPGCYESMNFKFIKFILLDARTKQRKQYYNDLIKLYPNKVIVFNKHKQVTKYLSTLSLQIDEL